MAEVRSPIGTELKDIIDFLDTQLRPEEKWSIVDEYPIAFNRHNLNNIRVFVEDGKILSHAVIKNLIVKTPMTIFKVAGIGSVVTSPEHRMKGYSQQVIQSCLDEASKQGADIAILWTDLYDFYRKMDFELSGTEIALIISKELEVSSKGLKINKSNKVDPNAILNLYSQHSIGSMRTANEIFNYMQIPNTQLYTAWDENNNLKAYAVEGRGADLSNYIHEWGGGVSSLIPLFNEIYKEKNAPVTIITPPNCVNLIRQMKELGAFYNEGFLGMITPCWLVSTKLACLVLKMYQMSISVSIGILIVCLEICLF